MFWRKKPYYQTKRGLNSRPLTPEEIKHILENSDNTGYTYTHSRSYSRNEPPEYAIPNLSRRSNLSASYMNGSFSSSNNSFYEEEGGGNAFSRAYRFFVSIITSNMFPLLFGVGILLLYVLCSRAPTSLDSSPFVPVLINESEFVPVSLSSSIKEEESPPSSMKNEDQQALNFSALFSMWNPLIFSQWEEQLDEIREEIQSINNTISHQEASDARTSAMIDERMEKVEESVNSLFEKELEALHMEKEQVIKAAEEGNRKLQEAANVSVTHEHHHHYKNVSVSEEEIAELVHQTLHHVNLSSFIEGIVRDYLQSHLFEAEQHRTAAVVELVEKKIQEAMHRFNADKTGEADFALESAGAAVVSIGNTEEHYHDSFRVTFFGIPIKYNAPSARTLIQRSSQNINPGECWAVKGEEASVVIKLARHINVTAVSYEHLPRELAISGKIDTAPQHFKVYSLQKEDDLNKVLIGKYIYDDQGESLQRFQAQHYDPRGTSFIEFELQSNYGAGFSCLYRLRVHGNPVEEQQDPEIL